jgi:hypothetical protein
VNSGGGFPRQPLWELLGSRVRVGVESCVHLGSSLWLQRGLLFWVTACVASLLLIGLTALLSRLPTGCLYFLGADLIHVVLMLKVSALSAQLGKPVLDNSDWLLP